MSLSPFCTDLSRQAGCQSRISGLDALLCTPFCGSLNILFYILFSVLECISKRHTEIIRLPYIFILSINHTLSNSIYTINTSGGSRISHLFRVYLIQSLNDWRGWRGRPKASERERAVLETFHKPRAHTTTPSLVSTLALALSFSLSIPHCP